MYYKNFFKNKPLYRASAEGRSEEPTEIPSQARLSFDKLIMNIVSNDESAEFESNPLLYQQLVNINNTSNNDIINILKHWVTLLNVKDHRSISPHYSPKYLLLVADEEKVHFIWLQVHAEWHHRMNMTKYSRPDFYWFLHAEMATKQNYGKYKIENRISRGDTAHINRIENEIHSILLDNYDIVTDKVRKTLYYSPDSPTTGRPHLIRKINYSGRSDKGESSSSGKRSFDEMYRSSDGTTCTESRGIRLINELLQYVRYE